MGPALLSFLLSAAPALAVDVSREIVLPRVVGLEIRGEIPAEIDASNVGLPLDFSIPGAALDSLLQGVGLPEVSGTFEQTRETPRCRVETTWSHGRFRVTLADKVWLRKKGPLCRFARHLNSRWCRPDSAEDLLGSNLGWGRIELTRSASRVVSDVLADRFGLVCAPDDVTPEQYRLNVLTSCAEVAGPYGESCETPFAGLPVRRAGDAYSVELQVFAERVTRGEGEPRIERFSRSRELTALRLGAYGALERAGGSWEGSMTVASALHAFGAEALPQAIEATYAVRDPSGEALADQVSRATLPAAAGAAYRVENFPLELRLARSEILELEELSDPSAGGAVAGEIGHWCRAFGGRFSPFGHYLCVERGADIAELLGTRTQLRLRFADQDGIERLLTWERLPPGERCRVTRNWGSIAFECDIPGPSSLPTWERWLADPSGDLKTAGTAILFQPLEGFLPRAEGVEPLDGFVEAQSRAFEIVP